MLREVLIGNSAVSTAPAEFNAVTYSELVVRGRSASSIPVQVAGELSEKLVSNCPPRTRALTAIRHRAAGTGWKCSRGTS